MIRLLIIFSLAICLGLCAATLPAQPNYALNRTATVTPACPDSYWVNGGSAATAHARLTDGITTTTGDVWGMMAAWDNTLTGPVEIIIDLGSVQTDIGEVYLDNAVNPWGSKALQSAAVGGSSDGSGYTNWGAMTDGGSGDVTHRWSWSGSAHAARFVKLTLNWPDLGNGSQALYEIGVLGGGVVTANNLALGAAATATPVFPAGYWVNGSSATALLRLTDGITTTTGDVWGMMAAYDNTLVSDAAIVVDLGASYTSIGSVRIDIAQNPWGSKNLGSGFVYGSTDGTNYTLWGPLTDTATGDVTHPWTWNGWAKTARYVKFQLSWPDLGNGSQAIYEIRVLDGGVPEPVNQAAGKSVTTSPEPPIGYWVNGGATTVAYARLTDGDTTTTGDVWGKMCAWDNTLNTPVTILLDLGSVVSNLGSAQLDVPVNAFGTKNLASAKLYGSSDGVNFQLWGSLADEGTGEQMHPWRWSGVARTARYVKFIVNWPDLGNGSQALYEVSVFDGGTPGPIIQNYALDTSTTSDPEFPGGYWVNGDVPTAHLRLTDGTTSQLGDVWGLMAAYDNTLNTTATIVVDLQEARTDIGSVRLDAAVNDFGTKNPSLIRVSGSSNGTTYVPWGLLSDGSSGSNMHEWTWAGDAPAARYVRFEVVWPDLLNGSQALYELYVFSKDQQPLNAVPASEWTLY
jgi:hypothetical protein